MEQKPSASKGYQKPVKKGKPAPMKKHASVDYASPLAKKWPAFIEAIEAGNDDAVKKLIKEGINVNLSRGGITPLMAAVSAGRDDIIALLLESGANVNEKNDDNETALHKAASDQSGASVIDLLLGFGADPEAKDRTGKTPLALAEEKKHAEVVRAIRRHEDRRRTDAREWNEFLNTAEGEPYRVKQHLEALESYAGLWWVPLAALGLAGLALSPLFGLVASLGAGVLLGALVAGGMRARMLMLSAQLDQYEPLPDLDIGLLRQKRAAGEPIGVVKRKKRPEAVAKPPVTPASSPVALSFDDPSPVLVEPEDGDILSAPADVRPVRSRAQGKVAVWKVVVPAVVIVLAALVAVSVVYREPITRRYYVFKLERSGMPFTGTAFLNAVANNDAAAVDLFIRAGATGSEKNEQGQTAVLIAAEKGYDALLRRLITLNTGMIGQPDSNGMTPLVAAAEQGNEATVRALIENHASVDQEAIGPDGPVTALQAVLDAPDFTEAHRKIFLYLLAKGADVRKRNASGESPLLLAAGQGNLDAVKALREKGADVRDADSDGETALYVASCQGHPDLIAFLLEQGADVNAATNEGDTSLLCAAREGETASVAVLVQKGARIDSRSPRGWTALTEASAAGNAEAVKLLLDMGANPSTGYVPEAYRGMKGNPVLIKGGKKTVGDVLKRLAGTATVDGYSVRYGELSSRKTTMGARGPWNVVLNQLVTKEHLFPLFREKEIYLIPYAPTARRGRS